MSRQPSKSSARSESAKHRLPPLQPNDSEDVVHARLSGETQHGDTGDPGVSLYDSPATYSTQSARSPQSAVLRSRRTKTPTTATPRSAQAIEEQLERTKTHIENRSLSKAFQRSIIHLLPMLVTAILFSLCAGEVYMGDLNGYPGQDVVLQALQFVVKAHEILMTMSLGDIVLHRIRYDLIVRSGVPFGLLTSAYQLGDLGYLFSSEFTSSMWRPRAHDPSFSRLVLSLLIAISCLLCLVVGPSSGVLFIPKLSWWPLKRPFGRTSLRVFSSNASRELSRPNPLTSYGCNGWLCPYFAADTICTWAGSLMWNDASGQIPFIDGGDNFYRWLMSNATNYDGWTVSTSPMMAMSTFVGAYWNWISYQGLAPTVSLIQPELSLEFLDGGTIFQPLVQVQCSLYHANESQLNLVLPNNRLVSTQADAYTNLTWPVPANYSDAKLSDYAENIYWTKLPTEQYKNAPSLGLIFVLVDEFETKSILPCSLVAHWVPSDLKVYPKTDRNIHTNSSNPLDIVNRTDVDLSTSSQIIFTDEWWAMLLPDDGSTHMEDVLHGISEGTDTDGLQTYHGASQGLAYRISTMISMFFADAIARYANADTHNVVFQDPHNGSEPFAQGLWDFDWPHSPIPEGYSSWVQYAEANPDVWREAALTIRRYGYAWSFSGVLSKFAGVALLIQALLALTHVALVLHGRWSSSAWDSIGNMIALALRSRGPAVPPDRRTGDEKKETWAETVSVRMVESELELMFNPTRAETLRLMQR